MNYINKDIQHRFKEGCVFLWVILQISILKIEVFSGSLDNYSKQSGSSSLLIGREINRDVLRINVCLIKWPYKTLAKVFRHLSSLYFIIMLTSLVFRKPDHIPKNESHLYHNVSALEVLDTHRVTQIRT